MDEFPTEEAAVMPGSDSRHATSTGGEGACSLHDRVGWVDKQCVWGGGIRSHCVAALHYSKQLKSPCAGLSRIEASTRKRAGVGSARVGGASVEMEYMFKNNRKNCSHSASS